VGERFSRFGLLERCPVAAEQAASPSGAAATLQLSGHPPDDGVPVIRYECHPLVVRSTRTLPGILRERTTSNELSTQKFVTLAAD